MDYTESFTDFAFQVDVTIVQGDDGGLVFRFSQAGGNGYTVNYCLSKGQHCTKGVGLYPITNNHIGQCLGRYTCIGNGDVPFLNTTLGAKNRLTVVCRRANIYLYVNGKYVSRTNDPIAQDYTYSSGAIGMFAYEDTHPTDVAFSNAKRGNYHKASVKTTARGIL